MLACYRVLLVFYAVFLPSYHNRSIILADYLLCNKHLR